MGQQHSPDGTTAFSGLEVPDIHEVDAVISVFDTDRAELDLSDGAFNQLSDPHHVGVYHGAPKLGFSASALEMSRAQVAISWR